MSTKTKQIRKQVAVEPTLPSSHLAALDDAGFTVIRYLNESIKVCCLGAERSEWLPGLCIAPGSDPDTYRVLEWLPVGHPANAYSFCGWRASSGHSSGGMFETISKALGWFKWVESQKVAR